MKNFLFWLFLVLPACELLAASENDRCQNAQPITPGVYEGETCTAGRDGSNSCAASSTAGDVWYVYTPVVDETITATTFGSNYDSVLSVHSGCPGTASNQIACSDDCGNQGSCVTFSAAAGTSYWIRVGGFQNNAGRFRLSVAREAGITGRVTDAVTGNPLPNVQVLVYIQETLEFVEMISTDSSGIYLAGGLSPGKYIVRTLNNAAFVDELYNNHYCEGVTCNPFLADVVTVQGGQFQTGVDFALDPGGRIAGTVTDASTGLPLQGVEVHVHDASNNHITLGFTDAAGKFVSFDGLPAGNYLVLALNHARYVDELYKQVPCPGASCSGAGATMVPVSLGATTPIDFSLNPGGLITGTITDSVTGTPITGVQVIVNDFFGTRITTGSTDASGFYRIFDGLPTDKYFVHSSNSRNYVDELYPDIPCMAGLCQINTGTTVSVTAGEETQLNFQLDPGAQLSGTVRSSSSGAPLQGILLDVVDSANRHLRYEFSDAEGKYSTHLGLVPGNYFIKSLNQIGFTDEIYNNVPCVASRCNVSQGTPIPLNPGETAGNIDFDLDAGGTVSGRVTAAATGLPLENVFVLLFDQSGALTTYGLSNSCGNYTTLFGVPENTFYARTLNSHGLVDEVYDDRLCLNGICDLFSGVPLDVQPGTRQIDFSLSEEILLQDEFDDGVVDWATSGGAWSETNGELTVTSLGSKAIAMAPLPWNPSGQTGCAGCTISLRMQNSGKASLRAWYLNKKNYVELQMISGTGRWHLRQISNGLVVGHSRARTALQPGIAYEAKVRFDGRSLSVLLDGKPVMTLRVKGNLSGNVGFTVKDGTAAFDSVLVY